MQRSPISHETTLVTDDGALVKIVEKTDFKTLAD
jgi:hypothetical protein